MKRDTEELVEKVRERYGRIAAQGGSCCASSAFAQLEVPEEPSVSEKLGYGRDQLQGVPEESDLGLGCGAPVAHLELQPGETVLDLGSGGGIDCFLAAREVGPTGRVIGVDMTPEMIERAQRNAARTGLRQVEFRLGRLEQLPVQDSSVDAVTSNCVINLVPDKGKVFEEIARVLRPSGRLVVSDIVLDGPLPEAIRNDLLAYVGCVAGAMQRQDYLAALADAGFPEVEILKDLDYVETVGETLPEEVQEFLERTGVSREEITGLVRSVTYRARR